MNRTGWSAAHRSGLPVSRLGRACSYLAADTQGLNQVLVSFRATAFQVLQETPPLGDHRQQTTPGMMILFMRLKMLSELQNSRAQYRYLNLWRPDIGLVDPMLRYQARFCFSRQCHARKNFLVLP